MDLERQKSSDTLVSEADTIMDMMTTSSTTGAVAGVGGGSGDKKKKGVGKPKGLDNDDGDNEDTNSSFDADSLCSTLHSRVTGQNVHNSNNNSNMIYNNSHNDNNSVSLNPRSLFKHPITYINNVGGNNNSSSQLTGFSSIGLSHPSSYQRTTSAGGATTTDHSHFTGVDSKSVSTFPSDTSSLLLMMEVDPKDVDFKALQSPQTNRVSMLQQQQLQGHCALEATREDHDPNAPVSTMPLNPPAATKADSESPAATVVTMMTRTSDHNAKMIPLDGAGGTSPFAAVARAAVEPTEDAAGDPQNTDQSSTPPPPVPVPMTPRTNAAMLSTKYTPSNEVDNFVMIAMLKEAKKQRNAATPTIKNG